MAVDIVQWPFAVTGKPGVVTKGTQKDFFVTCLKGEAQTEASLLLLPSSADL